MVSRRDFLAGLCAAALVAAIPGLGAAAGNGGNGNAGGNSGNGNGGGNGGNGNGNAGGNGKTKGKSAAPGGTTRPKKVDPSLPRLRVRHQNGFEEMLSGGRYHMTDNRGRTIVNRPATAADLARMRQLTAN
jgi:hypothetical protein